MTNLLLMIGVFGFSFVVGYFLISRIPTLLHTPLMSGSNAISGITVVGAVLSAGSQHTMVTTILGLFKAWPR